MIVVMGAPGAGKTTVLAKAVRESRGWHVVTWGDVMVELAKAKGLVKERDEMRKLPLEIMRKLQAETAGKLAMEKGKWVLDTHASINTPAGYYPGLPFSVLAKMGVGALVYVDAPIEDVMRRRKADATRRRDVQERRGLEEHVQINRALLGAYSAFTGAPVVIIENADGKLDAAVARLKALLG